MSRCPITYEECKGRKYSTNGLKKLSPKLNALKDFPYSAEEQVREAIARAAKMSIQGVQPKLSVRLNVKKEIFEIVDTGGRYISPCWPIPICPGKCARATTTTFCSAAIVCKAVSAT